MDAARSIYVQNPTIVAKTLLILIAKLDIMQQNLKNSPKSSSYKIMELACENFRKHLKIISNRAEIPDIFHGRYIHCHVNNYRADDNLQQYKYRKRR